MPIYEYRCPKCRYEFELRLTLDQFNSTAVCPKCYANCVKLTSSFACKTGSSLQASEKAFRKSSRK